MAVAYLPPAVADVRRSVADLAHVQISHRRVHRHGSMPSCWRTIGKRRFTRQTSRLSIPRTGGTVAARLDLTRDEEVLIKVVQELDHPSLPGGRDRDKVEHRPVLDNLAQPDSASVRADGDAVFRGKERDRGALVDASDPTAVDLQDSQRSALKELLEHHPVRDVLAEDQPPSDHGVTDHIVGAGWCLDPGDVERDQCLHPLDRLVDLPVLVGDHRYCVVRIADGPGGPQSAHFTADGRRKYQCPTLRRR